MQDVKLLVIPEYDAEGRPYGLTYLNKNHISSIVYSSLNGVLFVTMTSLVTTSGTREEPIFNKNHEKTKGIATGVVAMTKNETLEFRDKVTIISIHNYVTGETQTVESFLGFKMYDEAQAFLAEAREKKLQEESLKVIKKQYDDIVNQLDTENRYRGSSNLAPISVVDYIYKNYTDEEATAMISSFAPFLQPQAVDVETILTEKADGEVDNPIPVVETNTPLV